jgi:5'(3')-deoxyribonucleotidase
MKLNYSMILVLYSNMTYYKIIHLVDINYVICKNIVIFKKNIFVDENTYSFEIFKKILFLP